MLTLNAYRPLRLTEVMDRLFDDALARTGGATFDAYALPVDVMMKNDEYIITAAVPGLKPEELQVEVVGDVVTLRGETFTEQKEEKNDYLLQERRYGKFARTITLPTELDSAKAEAAVENGVLTLRVPKAEASKPKAIKVKAR